MFLLVMFFLTAGGDGSSLRNRRSVNLCWRADDFEPGALTGMILPIVLRLLTTVMMPFTFDHRRIALGFMSYLHHESVHRMLARSEPVCGGGRSSVCTGRLFWWISNWRGFRDIMSSDYAGELMIWIMLATLAVVFVVGFGR